MSDISAAKLANLIINDIDETVKKIMGFAKNCNLCSVNTFFADNYFNINKLDNSIWDEKLSTNTQNINKFIELTVKDLCNVVPDRKKYFECNNEYFDFNYILAIFKVNNIKIGEYKVTVTKIVYKDEDEFYKIHLDYAKNFLCDILTMELKKFNITELIKYKGGIFRFYYQNNIKDNVVYCKHIDELNENNVLPLITVIKDNEKYKTDLITVITKQIKGYVFEDIKKIFESFNIKIVMFDDVKKGLNEPVNSTLLGDPSTGFNNSGFNYSTGPQSSSFNPSTGMFSNNSGFNSSSGMFGPQSSGMFGPQSSGLFGPQSSGLFGPQFSGMFGNSSGTTPPPTVNNITYNIRQ